MIEKEKGKIKKKLLSVWKIYNSEIRIMIMLEIYECFDRYGNNYLYKNSSCLLFLNAQIFLCMDWQFFIITNLLSV